MLVCKQTLNQHGINFITHLITSRTSRFKGGAFSPPHPQENGISLVNLQQFFLAICLVGMTHLKRYTPENWRGTPNIGWIFSFQPCLWHSLGHHLQDLFKKHLFLVQTRHSRLVKVHGVEISWLIFFKISQKLLGPKILWVSRYSY